MTQSMTLNSFEDALKMIGKSYVDLPEVEIVYEEKKFIQWDNVFAQTEHGNNSENRILANNEKLMSDC